MMSAVSLRMLVDRGVRRDDGLLECVGDDNGALQRAVCRTLAKLLEDNLGCQRARDLPRRRAADTVGDHEERRDCFGPQYTGVILAERITMREIADEKGILIVLPYETHVGSPDDLNRTFWKRWKF
jgi:hypothetical protein